MYCAVLFRLAILAFQCWQCVTDSCGIHVLNVKGKDFKDDFKITSSIPSEVAAIRQMLTQPAAKYTAPAGKNILITFKVNGKHEWYFQEVCVQTKCVKRIVVWYHGPYKEVSFKSVSGKAQWIQEDPVEFPEEKTPSQQTCNSNQDTCFLEPQQLTKFSIKFVYSDNCEACKAVTIQQVTAKRCLVPKDNGPILDELWNSSTSKPVSEFVLNYGMRSKYRRGSSTKEAMSDLELMLKGSQSNYTAPNTLKRINIAYTPVNGGNVHVKELCVKTQCVSKVKVNYMGPLVKMSYLDATGKIVWKKSATQFPEEKTFGSPCSTNAECFMDPGQLSEFTLTFIKDNGCSKCSAIIVEDVYAKGEFLS